MPLLNSIFNSIKRFVSGVKNYLTLNIGNVITYASIDSKKAISKGFQTNGAVFSIVNKAAKKFAAINHVVYNSAGQPVDNPLTDLLENPNLHQGQDAFLESVYTYKLITGEAFIFLNRGDILDAQGDPLPDETIDKMPVLEMIVLPSDHIIIVPDPEDLWNVIGYILEVAGQYRSLRKNDIIHWHNTSLRFDPITRTHLRGISPLEPGYKVLQGNNDATDAAVSMYQNGGARGILANETFDSLSPAQQTQIKDVVDAKVNNRSEKGSVATIQGKWQYHNVGVTSIDMDLLKGREMSMKEMCALFDVPYELFQSDTTFANKEEAKRSWVRDHIIPASKQFDDELNRALLPIFNIAGIYIDHDYTGLPELEPDLGRLINALSNAWWITPNEKREMQNEEPFADPVFNEPWIPQGISPLSQMNDQQAIDDITAQLAKQGLIGAASYAEGADVLNGNSSSNGNGKMNGEAKAYSSVAKKKIIPKRKRVLNMFRDAVVGK